MDPIREQIELMTRRHFFGRTTGIGLGSVALASLLAETGQAAGIADLAKPRAGAATGGLAGLPHFPPKAKRAIYLHMNGGPSQMDLLDYKPKMDAVVRQGPARLDSPGPAADHDDQRPVPVPDRTLEVQVRPPRQVGHVGQRALALDGQDRRRDLPDQDGLDRGHQP